MVVVLEAWGMVIMRLVVILIDGDQQLALLKVVNCSIGFCDSISSNSL